jgi:5'-nucleotidase
VPYSLDDKLVIGISSQALFDLAEANAVYVGEGLESYRAYQRERENDVLAPGTGFPLVRALLDLNRHVEPAERLVEVIVISRNDADSAMRVFNSIEAHGLDVTRGAFTNGGESWRYLGAFHCGLFLSSERADVAAALRDRFPAALLLGPPEGIGTDPDPGPVRIAFDGDAVLFSDEAQRVYDEGKLPAFYEHERRRADEPLPPGPFRPFLDALGRIQARFGAEDPPIRTALVTARDAPAHRRVITTLRSWKVRIDETFFLGGIAKVEVLRVLKPHIFFDDQTEHLEAAASAVPSGHVPREQLELLPAEQLPPEQPKPKRVRSRRHATPAEKASADSEPTVDASQAKRPRAAYPSADREGSPKTPEAKEARRLRARAKPR